MNFGITIVISSIENTIQSNGEQDHEFALGFERVENREVGIDAKEKFVCEVEQYDGARGH
jgi:hypothetical protein